MPGLFLSQSGNFPASKASFRLKGAAELVERMLFDA